MICRNYFENYELNVERIFVKKVKFLLFEFIYVWHLVRIRILQLLEDAVKARGKYEGLPPSRTLL